MTSLGTSRSVTQILSEIQAKYFIGTHSDSMGLISPSSEWHPIHLVGQASRAPGRPTSRVHPFGPASAKHRVHGVGQASSAPGRPSLEGTGSAKVPSMHPLGQALRAPGRPQYSRELLGLDQLSSNELLDLDQFSSRELLGLDQLGTREMLGLDQLGSRGLLGQQCSRELLGLREQCSRELLGLDPLGTRGYSAKAPARPRKFLDQESCSTGQRDPCAWLILALEDFLGYDPT